jgi:hypothetical protein
MKWKSSTIHSRICYQYLIWIGYLVSDSAKKIIEFPTTIVIITPKKNIE